VQIKQTGVDLRLNTRVSREQLEREGFDEVIVATGVVPRALKIQGVLHHKYCLMLKCYVVLKLDKKLL
jgi:hypothetical protein